MKNCFIILLFLCSFFALANHPKNYDEVKQLFEQGNTPTISLKTVGLYTGRCYSIRFPEFENHSLLMIKVDQGKIYFWQRVNSTALDRNDAAVFDKLTSKEIDFTYNVTLPSVPQALDEDDKLVAEHNNLRMTLRKNENYFVTSDQVLETIKSLGAYMDEEAALGVSTYGLLQGEISEYCYFYKKVD